MDTGHTSSAMPASTTRASTSGSSAERTPWPSRPGRSRSRQVRTCSGAAQLAPVRHQQQPGPLGDREGRREVLGAPTPLVVGEPEAHDPAPGVLPGQPRQRAGVERVPGAVGRDHDRDAEAGVALGLRDRVEHQVGEGGDPAEPRGVPARVDLDLQPPAAVAHVVLGRLAHQPSHVVGRAQHRARHVVQPLEPEPALLVGRRQLRRPVRDQRVGQHDAVALGELEQRGVPHRPGEVQVQVGLGQVLDAAVRGRHAPAQAKSFCSRVIPSTRSSSPSA